jgi:hypothetical protein
LAFGEPDISTSKLKKGGKVSEMQSTRMTQSASRDFELIKRLLEKKDPFTYIRFSDGEMEIIRNQRLFIGDGRISWSKGEVLFSYPDFDFKDFLPERDEKLRTDLLASANFKNPFFFKGIPTSHNNALEDRKLMVKLNGETEENLTFADLLINENFLAFRKQLIPIFASFPHVHYFGNYRAHPELVSKNWKLVPLQDNFFENYETVLDISIARLSGLPADSLILSSASSLTNIVGHQLYKCRPDLTFLDIGTSMHDLVGMQSGIREYHILLSRNTPKNLIRKIRLISNPNFRLKW